MDDGPEGSVWHHSEGVGGAAWIGASEKQEVEHGLARGSQVVCWGWGQGAGDVPRHSVQVGLHQGSVQGTRKRVFVPQLSARSV